MFHEEWAVGTLRRTTSEKEKQPDYVRDYLVLKRNKGVSAKQLLRLRKSALRKQGWSLGTEEVGEMKK